jgi:hypothetical protein
MSLARARALAVIGVLAVIAIITVVWAIVTDDQTGTLANTCAVSADPRVPPPSAITVRIYNNSDTQGLAQTVQKQLKSRGFKVADVGNNPVNENLDKPAQIRYGPKGVGAANQLLAQFPGADYANDDRKDGTVDVVLNATFDKLTPKNQVAKILDEPHRIRPTAPAGC